MPPLSPQPPSLPPSPLPSPLLVHAAFGEFGNRLAFTFDGPTNRAGMTGIWPCAVVLAADTVALIKGAATAAPTCYWGDDQTLFANLNYLSTVRPGATLTLKPKAIGPIGVLTSSCAPLNPSCASGSTTISPTSPCGSVGQPTRACATPVARLSGPAALSSCPDATLKLSAEASSGGGALPLAYAFGIAETSDNAAAIGAALATQLATNATALLGEAQLAIGATGAGSNFAFTLTVTTALGQTSAPATLAVARASVAVPTLIIEGASTRTVYADRVTTVRAAVELASCFAGAKAVAFEWTLLASAVATSSFTPACGDAATVLSSSVAVDKAFLSLGAGALKGGCSYTFQVKAAMAGQPTIFSLASVTLVVEMQPLHAVIAGNERVFSAAAALELDGSASVNPNGGALAYAWTVATLAGAPVALPDGVSTALAKLALPAGALPADVAYVFSLAVSSPSVASESASVVVRALSTTVPSISFGAFAKEKYAATWALRSRRIALAASLDAAAAALDKQDAFTFAWAAYTLVNGARAPAGLALADANAVTTTGAARPTLAFRSGALSPGVTYLFELTVAPAAGFNFDGAGYGAASASTIITINRPPFGGALTFEPAGGFTLTTGFTLTAAGWNDDAEDLPLLFSFGYVDAAGAAQTVTSATTQPSIAGLVLPAGDLVMTVVVADQLGATATATGATPLTVATQALSAGAVDDLLSSTDAILNSGNPEAAQRLLVALAKYAKTTGRRRQLQSTSAAAFNTTQIASMLATAAQAAALSDGSAEARLQSAGVLAALLSALPDVLDGPTRVQGLEQLRDLLESASADGVDSGMVANAATALDAVLLADAAEIGASDQVAIGTSGTSAIFTLGLALLAGAAADEAPAEANGTAFTMTASRSTAEGLAGATLAPPSGSTALASLPAGVLDGQPGSLADGVDVVLYTLETNAYADPTAQAGAAIAGLGTKLVSLQLANATDGGELAISNLLAPILLALPRADTGGGSCASAADCSGSARGACVAGACACASPYAGANCADVSACGYWGASSGLWLTDGCVTLEPAVEPAYSDALAAANVVDRASVVLCACDHLTTFAGLVAADAIVSPPPPPPGPPSPPPRALGAARASSSRGATRVETFGAPPAADAPAALIGLVVGGVALLCCIALTLLAALRARRGRKQQPVALVTVAQTVSAGRADSVAARAGVVVAGQATHV